MSFVAKVKTSNDQGGVSYNPVGSSLYGVCGVPGSVPEKTVSVGLDGLMGGITVHVKFTYGNTVANPTLNVDGLGALPIYTHYTVRPTESQVTSWADSSVVSFTYDDTEDGECWRMNDTGANAAIVGQAHQEVVNEENSRIAADTMVLSRIAPDYDATATYHINDMRVYDQQLYRCKVEITEPEAWTAAHWEATTVAGEREYKLEFFDTEINKQSTISAEVTGTGVTAVSVDRTLFEAVISEDGTYVFEFVNTEWVYNTNIVILANYGISVTGTPANGDVITVTYVKGEFEFKLNGTYAAYPYRAQVDLEGVDANMIPEVVFRLEDAISGIFAPISETFAGGIYLYATNVPATAITIPTIVCKR